MAMKIVSERDNKIMKRREIQAELDFTGPTPKKDDVKAMIAAKFGCEPSLVAVRKITNAYGELKACVIARVYENADDFKKLETTSKKAKAKPASADAETGAKK